MKVRYLRHLFALFFLFVSFNAFSQNKTFEGKVLDNNNEPLPGASVIVEGTTRGVTTDLDGVFRIEVRSSDHLVISFIGMKSETIAVGNQQSVVIVLQPQTSELEEVTVVAYGTQKKESVIGAITTVKIDEIKMPVGRISNTLAGQMAGIVSVQATGEPGVGSNFWIRGISTFGANSTPLILVDGIERPLDLVDFEDIASLSILKDATATAVYGVRGANGIVLITTKRGRESAKPIVTAKIDYGILYPVVLPKLANTEQWIDYYNDIIFDSTGQLAFQEYQRNNFLDGSDPDLYPSIDWMKTVFKNSSPNQRVNISVAGGGSVIKYYVAGSYYTENGIFNPVVTEYNPSMRYSRFNFRSNIDIDLTTSTKIALNLSNQYETKNRLGTDLSTMWSMVFSTTPVATPPIFSDGTYAQPLVGLNPYYALNNTGFSQDFNNTTQSLVSLTQDFSSFINGLKADIRFSWDAVNASTLDKRKTPATYYASGRDDDGQLIFHKNKDGSDYLSLSRSNSGNRTTNLEASLTYDNVLYDVHRLGGLFLFSMREHTNNFPGNYIAAFPYRNIGIAGRLTYSYRDVYFVEGNFGYNGSENFAPAHRFGFFPSIALGYLISNEKYFQDLLPVIDLLKIKGSYGMIGNDQIGGNRRFAFNSEMTSTGSFYFGSTGQNYLSGIATGYPGNPFVSWESSTKKNIGLEIGFFNKLKIQADYFSDLRDGIYIQQESVPSVVGMNVTQYVNLGKMENKGIDASLEYTQTYNELTISARANYTFNRNKILYDDRPTPIYPYQERVNQPYGQHTGYIALGLFESEDEIKNSPTQTFDNPVPGDIKYKDINGDGIISQYDMVAIGYSTIPQINYGFGTSLIWKGFDLSLFFHGVDNVSRMITGDPIRGASASILVNGQIYADVAENRWTIRNPDPNARYPRLSTVTKENNKQPSTFWLRDMSFLRLKNAEFGYTLPTAISKRLHSTAIRFYVQGVNLLTLSNFKLWDPELSTGSGAIYPQMSTISLGLNLNF